MTNSFDISAEINRGVLWPDAELDKIEIDYEQVSINLTESSGASKCVICSGYIGYEMVGAWDEIVISKAEIFGEHDFLKRCTDNIAKRLGKKCADSGSIARNKRQSFLLQVEFTDGSKFRVAASVFTAVAT